MPESFGLICWLARLLLPSPSQPHTLHLALKTNARPVQSCTGRAAGMAEAGTGLGALFTKLVHDLVHMSRR